MSERTRNTLDHPDLIQYTQGDLETALNDFLKEKEPPQKVNLFNYKTIVGTGMLFMTSLFLLQQLPWINFGIDAELIELTFPILGGVLVTLVGLGIISRPKRPKKSKVRYDPNSSNAMLNQEVDATYYEPYALSRKKKLYRSRSNKRFLGVCGGIAGYFGLNPLAVRILWAILTLSSAGFMIPMYVLMAIIMPKEPPMFRLPEET